MTTERIWLRWPPLALLRWEVHVKRLDFGHVYGIREPAARHSSSGPGSTPPWPTIDVDRLSIDALVLEPAVAGREARLAVQGEPRDEAMEKMCVPG